MCEIQWNALAEIYLKKENQPKEIYCLCSRVFIRNKDDSLKLNSAELSASEEENLIEDELSSECNTLPNILKNKLEHEPVSCYCSASHTDNLSTDEHDSLRDSHDSRTLHKGIQSSDSGADLTDYIKLDIDFDWQKYWSINGEKLIWESWIAKYSAYINPNYLHLTPPSNQTDLLTDKLIEIDDDDDEFRDELNYINSDRKDDTFAGASATTTTLLTLNIEPIFTNKLDQLTTIEENRPLVQQTTSDLKRTDLELKNRILVRNLSGSDDKFENTEISEGWNPLSPISIDCDTDVEQLLSSRCASSRPDSSLRTVDSMTNVTRMTISSLEFSQSSQNSDSFSSVSSVQSSLSSTASDEIEEDYQRQWNVLWKRHYEEELLKQYDLFVLLWKERNGNLCVENIDDKVVIPNSISNRVAASPAVKKVEKEEEENRKSPLEFCNSITKSLGHLLNNLRMSSNDSSLVSRANELSQQSESDNNEPPEDEEISNVAVCAVAVEHEDTDQMIAWGLPTAFISKGVKRHSSGETETAQKTNTGDFESCRNKVRAAFNLMGIEYHDNKISPIMTGRVQYQMKHIRLQNLQYGINKKAKHIYFDDDGNALFTDNNIAAANEENFLNILPICLDNKLPSSGDEEIVSNDLPSLPLSMTATVNVDEQATSDEIVTLKRKKRKKKFLMPQEIRENRQLRRYWHKRFTLFSKFNEGIKLDEESWYSVTPESLAKHVAERCKCNVIVDGFCGAGGNTIQLAFTCEKVIAIDIDPKKIELAKNNAKVYGVEDRIEFIIGDFLTLVDNLKADVVFFSPPWGGPSYLKEPVYDLETMLKPIPVSQLLESARKITDNIAIFLPKNSDSCQLMSGVEPSDIEIEQNIVKNNLIGITAYYNDLVKKI